MLVLLLVLLVASTIRADDSPKGGAVQVKEPAPEEKNDENADVRTKARYLEKLTEQAIYQKMAQKQRMIVYFTRDPP